MNVQFLFFIDMFFFAVVDQGGVENPVINANHILVVNMVTAMALHGNVFVTQTGVEFFVIKVRRYQLRIFKYWI